MAHVKISHIPKPKLLAALYNRAIPLGMGFMHYTPADMTENQATQILETGQTYFDYVEGRVMKVDLSGDELNTAMYNRDMGEGAAEEVISRLQ